jgi:hypothetical protein
MAPLSIIEWIISLVKCHKNASNQWKELAFDFPLIGEYLVCKVGDKTKILIGDDVIMGCENNIILLVDLVQHLCGHGLNALN